MLDAAPLPSFVIVCQEWVSPLTDRHPQATEREAANTRCTSFGLLTGPLLWTILSCWVYVCLYGHHNVLQSLCMDLLWAPYVFLVAGVLQLHLRVWDFLDLRRSPMHPL